MAIDTLSVSQELYVDSFRRSLRAKNVAERTVQTYCEGNYIQSCAPALYAGAFAHLEHRPERSRTAG